MSGTIEDRLRAAFQAKTELVTDQRLEQLDEFAGTERTVDLPMLEPLDAAPTRLRRWAAPALAAAAAVLVAVGAVAVAGARHHGEPAPNPPASSITQPPAPTPSGHPSSVPSSSGGTPTGSAPSGPALSYLGRGSTGTREQVPWSAVGAGWRLVQPQQASVSGRSVYLYDPAGGRYLITDQLPGGSSVSGWSPDGSRAAVTSGGGSQTLIQQLDLRTGTVSSGFSQYVGHFVSYTEPRGLAMLVSGQVQGTSRLLRYGLDGTLQLAYPASIPGVGTLSSLTGLYTPDGAEFVAAATSTSVLLGNDGHLVRTFGLPGASAQNCYPVKLWSADELLETCLADSAQRQLSSLYLQPLSGGAPQLLVDGAASTVLGYADAWQLSNGDLLLQRAVGCGDGGFDIRQVSDGTVRPLRLPAGVSAPGAIQNVDGDVATFRVRMDNHSACDASQGARFQLVDYNLVTGQTDRLLAGEAGIVNYPR